MRLIPSTLAAPTISGEGAHNRRPSYRRTHRALALLVAAALALAVVFAATSLPAAAVARAAPKRPRHRHHHKERDQNQQGFVDYDGYEAMEYDGGRRFAAGVADEAAYNDE
ncbi:hypothetical protein HK405_005630 [Cladochytrium tenue]|nr:hypothetical protein HK405_005630 [Cladochytrium tenue]